MATFYRTPTTQDFPMINLDTVKYIRFHDDTKEISFKLIDASQTIWKFESQVLYERDRDILKNLAINPS